MNYTKFLFSIWLSAILVGLYQLPLIQNSFLKYNLDLDISQYLSYSQNLQQNIEDQKISFSAYLDNLDNGKPNENISIVKEDKKEINNQIKNSLENSNALNISHVKVPPLLVENININKNISQENHLSKDVLAFNNTTNNDTANQIRESNFISECKTNCKILMIGDSVMGDVYYSLSRLLKKSQPTWQVINAHKVSSGIVNQTYYDWPKTSAKLISQHQPDYVFVLIGTNDGQGMMINKKGYAVGKDAWLEEYQNRVGQIVDDFDQHHAQWFWVQLPVVRDLSLNKNLQFVRLAQSNVVKSHLIETESLFGKTDHSQEIDMSLRAPDGTHLNVSGANMVAKHIYKYLKNKNTIVDDIPQEIPKEIKSIKEKKVLNSDIEK